MSDIKSKRQSRFQDFPKMFENAGTDPAFASMKSDQQKLLRIQCNYIKLPNSIEEKSPSRKLKKLGLKQDESTTAEATESLLDIALRHLERNKRTTRRVRRTQYEIVIDSVSRDEVIVRLFAGQDAPPRTAALPITRLAVARLPHRLAPGDRFSWRIARVETGVRSHSDEHIEYIKPPTLSADAIAAIFSDDSDYFPKHEYGT